MFLSHHHGSAGAASALLLGGVTNTVLAIWASRRQVGHVPITPAAGPALIVTTVSMVVGAGVTAVAGVIAGTIAACLLFVAIAARQDNELVRIIRGWAGMRR